jgi:HPt (histidine-containing phosphotransfer) domain-containing protein
MAPSTSANLGGGRMSLQDLLAQLRKEYLASLPEKVRHIRKLYQMGDFNLVETEFHKLKGTGRTYGFSEISQLGQMAEELCQANIQIRGEMVEIAFDLLGQIYQMRNQNQVLDLEAQPGYTRLLQLVEIYHAQNQGQTG